MTRFVVEGWAPEYGSPLDIADEEVFDPGRVDLNAEVPEGSWSPVRPGEVTVPRSVLFVDGVRRIDARIWLEDDAGVRQGICASYAAGVVRCEEHAEVQPPKVARGLFAPSPEPISAGNHGVYRAHAAAGSDARQLSAALQEQLRQLEVEVATTAAPADLVVIDGPLSYREGIPWAMGYIKSHSARYLSPEGEAVRAALEPGERTPYFFIQSSGSGISRYSWYLRLPGGPPHPLGGIARCEVATTLSRAEVAHFADVSARLLPRFASSSHRESRAPQNLYPIAGLEAALRRRLGDRDLLERALRREAAAG